MGRVRQLREILGREQMEIVGLQETFKQNFSNQDWAIDPGELLAGTRILLEAIQGAF